AGSPGLWTFVPANPAISFSDATLFNPAVSTTVYGTYTLQFTETNGTCFNSNTVDVTFNEQPTATIATAGPVNECGLTTDLQATPFVYAVSNLPTSTWSYTGPGGAVVTWNGGDATDPDQTGLAVDTYGTYVFTWTETNGSGLCIATANITVNFYEQPTANAGADVAECDQTIQLNAIQSVAASTGLWTVVPANPAISFSDATLFNPAVSTTVYGTYTLQFTETNGTCFNSNTVDVTFNEQPTATIATAGPVNECGLTTDLQATPFVYAVSNLPTSTWSYTGPGGAVVTWNGGDATDPDQTGLSVDTYGTYVFTWTESNGAGQCISTDNITVNFCEQPSADAGSNAAICGTTYVLAAVKDVSTSSGLWTLQTPPGGGSLNFADASSPTSSVTTNGIYGNYLIRWTETNGTCSSFEEITLTFNEIP